MCDYIYTMSKKRRSPKPTKPTKKKFFQKKSSKKVAKRSTKRVKKKVETKKLSRYAHVQKILSAYAKKRGLHFKPGEFSRKASELTKATEKFSLAYIRKNIHPLYCEFVKVAPKQKIPFRDSFPYYLASTEFLAQEYDCILISVEFTPPGEPKMFFKGYNTNVINWYNTDVHQICRTYDKDYPHFKKVADDGKSFVDYIIEFGKPDAATIADLQDKGKLPKTPTPTPTPTPPAPASEAVRLEEIKLEQLKAIRDTERAKAITGLTDLYNKGLISAAEFREMYADIKLKG